MASLVPPPTPSASRMLAHGPTTTRPAAQRPPMVPASSGPIRSARRVKKGVVSTGTDVQHVIRVTVLGLAGITVDRTKCSDNKKLTLEERENLPPPPSRMRAVVALSRSSQIKGITSLSKPLTRSPNDDVVLTASDDETSGTGRASSRTGSRAGSRANKRRADSESFGSEVGRAQRHVAVWASENKSGLGSSVVFEANLHRKDNIGGRASPSSNAFAPKSFELTIALTEDSRGSSRVALPLGVTTLAIAGDECESGKPVVLDLSVLSLEQARPLESHKNGVSGYPMISINENPTQVESTLEDDAVKRKRLGLKRFFSRKSETEEEKPVQKLPTLAERKAFSEAYSTDGTGDAILRVSMEVYEKGSELARRFEPESGTNSALGTSWVSESSTKLSTSPGFKTSDHPRGEMPSQIPLEVTTTVPSKERAHEITKLEKGFNAGFASSSRAKSSFQPIRVAPRLATKPSELLRVEADIANRCETIGLPQKGYAIRPTDSSTTETSSGRTGSSFAPSDRSSQDASRSSTKDSDDSDRHFHVERAAESTAKPESLQYDPSALNKMHSIETEGNDTFNDDYTLSFTKKSQSEVEHVELPSHSIKLFGRQFDIPSCGAWTPGTMERADGVKTDFVLNNNNNDDFTYITADFFGRDVRIPLCSFRTKDDETVSATTFTNGWTQNQATGFVDKICRSGRSDAPRDDEETLSWITNLTDGTQPKKKLSLKDYVRLSLQDMKKSDSQTLNSLISTEDSTVDEDNTYYEGITVDEDGTATLEAREGSDQHSASIDGSSKRSDRIEETVQSHSPALRTPETYSKRIIELSASTTPRQVPVSEARPSMSQHFAELFSCRTSSTTLDEHVVQYEPFQSDVPPMILHADDDNASLGDLTANTHEKIINNARNGRGTDNNSNSSKTNGSRTRNSGNNMLVPLPVAFGGDGLCVGTEKDQVAVGSPIPFENQDRVNSILSLNPSFENYFADYDDYSILSPEAKARALAHHTQIIPSLSSSSSAVYKEKIVLIEPASPVSSRASRRKSTGSSGVGFYASER